MSSYPKYNSDCKEYLGVHGVRQLSSAELCVDVDSDDPRSLTGDPLVWYKRRAADNSSTQYLVGLISYGNSQQQLFVHTRISAYVGWIKSVA